MKRTGLITAVLLGALVVQAWSAQTGMSVQVRNGVVRETPSFMGKVIGKVAYGDRVTVLGHEQGWAKINAAGLTGWIHDSALTRKHIKVGTGTRDAAVTASGDELALAGKGFSKEVEQEFRADNRDVDFTMVDRMEKIVVPDQKIIAFLEAGNVHPLHKGRK